MEIKALTKTQQEEANDLLKFYKAVYICKVCKKIYGSDYKEEELICQKCEFKRREKKK